MEAFEQLSYILRLMVVSLSVLIFAVLLFLYAPTIDPTKVTADVLAGKVAYSAEYMIAPGVVDQNLFSSEHVVDSAYFDSQELKFGYGVRAILLDVEKNQIGEPVLFNRNYWEKINPALSYVELVYSSSFPILIQHEGNEENGLLRIEVWHE